MVRRNREGKGGKEKGVWGEKGSGRKKGREGERESEEKRREDRRSEEKARDPLLFPLQDEDHLDLVRVLITGPTGTPYSRGCFVFDIFYPVSYPTNPPLVVMTTTGGGTVR